MEYEDAWPNGAFIIRRTRENAPQRDAVSTISDFAYDDVLPRLGLPRLG